MDFNLDEAIAVANQAVAAHVSRNLKDVEIIVLRGAWERWDYDQIAAQNGYSTSYLSQDVAPKLWKLLSDALGERVRKSNFKEALRRRWNQTAPDIPDGDTGGGSSPPPPPPTPAPSDYYIERPRIEQRCHDTLLQPGSLLRLKAPSLMGKTSLIARVLSHLATEGYRSVSLSFDLCDRQVHLTDFNKFLKWFCANVTRELGLENQLEEFWDEEGMGAKVSCSSYFEEYLLVELQGAPLVLCLDDVDLLFPYPEIYEDFFGLLRSWHEKSRSRRQWQQLRLVIVHATDVYIQLNINQSPFNVGVPIELPEFSESEVLAFARLHGIEPTGDRIGESGLAPLVEMVGGHPYLLELAFIHLKNNPQRTLAQLLAEAATEAGIYGHHLREHWQTLQGNSLLAKAFQAVIEANGPIRLEPIEAYQLQSMGLLKLQGNEALLRCNLYREYFKPHLNELV
ncbi:MAG: AAA-like domain-containing protein [Cyanobacteria bacterium J06641_5]